MSADSQVPINRIVPAAPFQVPWASDGIDDTFGLAIELHFNHACQLFRWISPGRFLMGSPTDEPERGVSELLHEVTLSRGFWLADTACTQDFWMAVWPVNPSHFQDDARNPVENVAWHDAQRFIAELNRRLPGLEARLPSEAEWEYACRAGTNTPFAFGHTVTTEQVNYHGRYPYVGGEPGVHRQRTVAAASLPANAWGLHQMHGNVWEWCADWYGDYSPEPQLDPRGPVAGNMRVLRGGTWSDPARYSRSAARSRIEPAYRPRSTGFRLALGFR